MDNFDKLDDLLNKWEDQSPLNPHLKNKVWMRIASTNQETGSLGLLNRLLAHIELAFKKPLIAGAFLAICLVSGLAIGELRVNEIKQKQMAVLAQQYLRLIEPQESTPVERVDR